MIDSYGKATVENPFHKVCQNLWLRRSPKVNRVILSEGQRVYIAFHSTIPCYFI